MVANLCEAILPTTSALFTQRHRNFAFRIRAPASAMTSGKDAPRTPLLSKRILETDEPIMVQVRIENEPYMFPFFHRSSIPRRLATIVSVTLCTLFTLPLPPLLQSMSKHTNFQEHVETYTQNVPDSRCKLFSQMTKLLSATTNTDVLSLGQVHPPRMPCLRAYLFYFSLVMRHVVVRSST